MNVLEWLFAHRGVVWAVLFAASEVLGLLPQAKNNAILEYVLKFMKRISRRD